LRANALGDLIFSLPALEALRVAYPNAEITLLGRAMHEQLLTSRPAPVDRVFVLPPIQGVSATDERETEECVAAQALEALRNEGFDVAIQMHGGGFNSNPFIRRLGARHTVGLRTSCAEPLDQWMPYFYYQHEVFRYLEVVALLDAIPTTLEPRLAVTERDLYEAAPVLNRVDGPFVVLHPGASDARRRWPASRFASVGDCLATAGASVVVTGTGDERSLVQEVIDRMSAPAIGACDRLSLCGLAGLLARSSVVVSNDTGPLHLAAAVATPTVGIFWCGNLLTTAPLSRTLHRPLPSWQVNCPVCGRHTSQPRCEHDTSFVAEVGVDQVVEAAMELWRDRTTVSQPDQR
jgi:ADP-heptose:LPS heptosyltransferase